MNPISKTTLNKWSEMTDNNQHSEVLEKIANYFTVYSNQYKNYSKFYLIFNSIRVICDVEQCCPNEIFQYRTTKMHELLDTIKRFEGEEIYNQINNCL